MKTLFDLHRITKPFLKTFEQNHNLYKIQNSARTLQFFTVDIFEICNTKYSNLLTFRRCCYSHKVIWK